MGFFRSTIRITNCIEYVLFCKNETLYGVNFVEWSTCIEHIETESRFYQLLDTYTLFFLDELFG